MKYLKNSYLLLLLLLLLGLFVTSSSQAQYSPYFENYSLSEYNAGNQNWGISKADNGKIYVANNKGLLEFDGIKWNFYELPNKTTIRSVLAVGDKIYTGSYEEFGYWQKNSKGSLVYTSISNFKAQKPSMDEEFWQIVAINDTIVFRSFSNLYIYKDEKLIKIKPSSTVMSISIVKNQLFVATLKNGVFLLENDILRPYINDPVLKDNIIISLFEYQNEIILTTALKGCYIYKNNRLQVWNSDINEVVKAHQLNSFSQLKNGFLVFGTIKNGAYITDEKGKTIYHISKENGLLNNTILSQHVDGSKLWLGLDNGLASMDLNSHHSFFNDISGKLGAVYDVINFKGTTYIGSNTGLFYLDADDKLQFIEGSQGQVWDLKDIDGELFCGHNNGTYIIDNKTLILISKFTGGWVIKKVPEQKHTYIQGTYAGLVKFIKGNNAWQVKHLGKTTIPVRFVVFEDTETAWVAHAYSGLYKVKFDKNYDTITEIKSYENKGLLSKFNVRVYKLKNEICFKTNEGWQRYEPLLDSIVPYPLLNGTLGKDTYIVSETDSEDLVFKNKMDIINFRKIGSSKNDLSLTSKFFKNRLIVGHEKVSKINDSIFALNLNDGFMLIDGKNYNQSNSLFKPIIEKVEINKNLMELKAQEIIESPINNNVSIVVSSPKSNNHYLEYSISNSDTTSWYKIDKDKLELSNLKDGDYTILFRASDNFGNISEVTTVKVRVLPPWYKDTLGFVLYFFIVISVAFIFYMLHKRKIYKEQRLLQLKLKKEQREALREKAIENEKKLVEIKNESLKNEVKLKSKQLANTAMALVKKNEALQELKKEIMIHKSGFDNHFSFKKLLSKIDNSISQKDEWKVFEYNFNQVHEEFFSQLKKEFPDLTHKDLKICAYIKMNLTTKEIAPLLNISTRGVETHRYRLKRKLNLENDNSLTAFLRNYK